MLLAVTTSSAFAGDFCTNPTIWPVTIGVSTVAGQTTLAFLPAVIGAILDEEITVVGNDVTIAGNLFTACAIGVPPPAFSQTFLVGALQPGTYRLRVIFKNLQGVPNTVDRTFVVGAGGAPFASVPTLSARGTLLLALIFCLVAGLARRQ